MKNLRTFHLKTFKSRVLVFTLLTGCCATGWALDYLGAEGVLKLVKERNATVTPAPADDQSKLRDELKAFQAASTNLAPAEAARRWLELADRAAKAQRRAAMHYDPNTRPVEGDDLLAVLPPPPAWGELAKAIAARPAAKGAAEMRELGLRFLAATLTGDTEGQNREITKLSAKAKDASHRDAYLYANYLEQISQTLLAMSDNPDAILKSLRRQLEAASGRDNQQQITVPNLVSLVGAEKANAFLKQALTTPNVTLQFQQSNETSRQAQKLALELMSQLKSAQWGLINSLDAVALYEAMDKRFGKSTNELASAADASLPGLPNLPDVSGLTANFGYDGSGKSEAQIYYMLGLIADGRTQDAVAVAKKLKDQDNAYYFDEAFKAMEHAGLAGALDDFLHELLTQDPSLPFWSQYVELAVRAGQSERMLALVRSALGKENLSETRKTDLHEILFKALLAADNTDAAVVEMRLLIASEAELSPTGDNLNAGRLGLMLARLGVLLQKPEWVEEGIGAAKKWLARPDAQKGSGGEPQNISKALAEMLTELNRGPAAESILTEALALATQTNAVQPRYRWNSDSSAQGILTDLTMLYDRANRSADVLALLEQSPDWGAADLSGLFRSTCGESSINVMWLHAGSSAAPVPYLAARALLATGRTEPAQKITDALLDQFPGMDRGYELLIKLKGSNAIPRLDELFKRDQFEERPLIWKAHLLRQQNQLAEAEKIARQAIAIDPSDGEEGRGDRMRVYAVLADIREARGDKKEADFLREVVKAIRLSEDADQFYAAGLLKRAIGMYEEGLKHFSDAYCIQSRLAIQMSAMGLNEQAEEHYRRAYELMPDSFGRVESHCFGCEKAFDGERAQSIAEKVFTTIAAESPAKPQVHYLLGYLREEEERYNEARTNYLTAVRLDPDYLNAWVKVQEVGEQSLVPAKERDQIAFNILRLDPLQRHARPSLERVTDLAGLWNAVTAASTHQIVPATNLLVLTASKVALEKKPAQPNEGFYFHYREISGENESPASSVAQAPFVRLAGEMILNQNSSLDE